MFIDWQYKEGNILGVYNLPTFWATHRFDHLNGPTDRSLIHMLEFWE